MEKCETLETVIQDDVPRTLKMLFVEEKLLRLISFSFLKFDNLDAQMGYLREMYWVPWQLTKILSSDATTNP